MEKDKMEKIKYPWWIWILIITFFMAVIILIKILITKS